MSDAIRVEVQAADWIARRDSGQWHDGADFELEQWLCESPAHRVAFLRLQSAWSRADRLRALHSPVQPMSPAISASAQRSVRSTGWAYRAVAAFALLAIGLLLSGDPGRFSGQQRYFTPIGARETVALEDGSKLTLNTSTELRALINDRERQVWLDDGEAYFDVAHDATRPFVILMGSQRITVLGTQFTVRRDAAELHVNVLEGRVQVQVDGAAPTVLTRDESATGAGTNLVVTRRSRRQSLVETSWLEGRLIFDQVTLADAATQFNRYNRKKLVIADAAAANIQIGGTFDATNVEAFARLMRSGFGLTLQTHADQVVVSSGPLAPAEVAAPDGKSSPASTAR